MEVEEEGEESKWQDRISSGFDRLVEFASTELDKRRRSTEGGECCNTSPDSGIGHGSDHPPNTVTLSGMKRADMYKLNINQKPSMFKAPAMKSFSPIVDQPLEEAGPPRTPSPSSSPNFPVSYIPSALDGFDINYRIQDKLSNQLNPALFKYQRQEIEKRITRPDHHFKKKFYYREQWRGNETENSWHRQNNEDQSDVSYKPRNVTVGLAMSSASTSQGDWEWNKEITNPPSSANVVNYAIHSNDNSVQWSHNNGARDKNSVENN